MRILPQWWRAYFLWAELGLAILIAVGAWVLSTQLNGGDALDALLQGNRGAIYGTLASVFGSLLGFAITAVSIVIGFASHERLALIRQSKQYRTIWQVFFAAIRSLGLATLVALAGLIVDRDAGPIGWMPYAVIFSSVLATFRVARCAWVLENVIEIISHDPK